MSSSLAAFEKQQQSFGRVEEAHHHWRVCNVKSGSKGERFDVVTCWYKGDITYSFGVDQFITVEHLHNWLEHLCQKNWVTARQLDQLVKLFYDLHEKRLIQEYEARGREV